MAIARTNFYYVIVFHTAEVRTWCENRSRRVSTRELSSRPSHIQEYVDSVLGGSTFCSFAASCSMLRLTLAFAFSRSFWVSVDNLYVIFLGSVGLSCKKNLYEAILSLHIQISLCIRSTVKRHPTKFWRISNLAGIKFSGARTNHQTAKLNSPPNFLAIQYVVTPQDAD